jgi:hypothetical protein
MFLSLAKDTALVKAALLDSGTIIDKAMKFVSRVQKSGRGLTSENSNPLLDDTEKQAQSGSNITTTKHKKEVT